MFTLYRIVKWSVEETVPAQCEQQQVLRCVAEYVSLWKAEQITAPEQTLLRNHVSCVNRSSIRYTFCDALFHYWYSVNID